MTPAERAEAAYLAASRARQEKRTQLAQRAVELLGQWVNGASWVHVRVAVKALEVLTDHVDQYRPEDRGESPREVLTELRGYLDREREAGQRRLDEAERNDRDETAGRERQRLETLDDVAKYLGGVG